LPFEGGFTGAMDVVFLELRAFQSIFSMLQQTNDGATGALETWTYSTGGASSGGAFSAAGGASVAVAVAVGFSVWF